MSIVADANAAPSQPTMDNAAAPPRNQQVKVRSAQTSETARPLPALQKHRRPKAKPYRGGGLLYTATWNRRAKKEIPVIQTNEISEFSGQLHLEGASHMGILAWLIVGLIAGFIGSKIVNRAGEGLVRDIILGIIGAVVGGAIFERLGYVGVTGINLSSIVVAVIGAVIVLVVYHGLTSLRAGARA